MQNTRLAIITIGSEEVNLLIANKCRGFSIEEELSYPLAIGEVAFSEKFIDFSLIHQLANIIKNYQLKCQEYLIENDLIFIYASSAFREANNREIIIDYIKERTGFRILVLEAIIEQTLAFSYLLETSSNYQELPNILMYLSTGNFSLAKEIDDQLIYFNFHTGSKKLHHRIKSNSSSNITSLTNEVLSSYLLKLDKLVDNNLTRVFLAGQHISLLNKVFFRSDHIIDRESFLQVNKLIKNQTSNQLANRLNLSLAEATKLSALIPFLEFIFTNNCVKEILFLNVRLEHILLNSHFTSQTNEIIAKKHLNYQRKLYQDDISHTNFVKDIALLLYDNLLNKDDYNSRLILEIAALVHDLGKTININKHAKHSAYLISNLDILGLNKHQKNLISQIILHHKNPTAIKASGVLTTNDMILATKLIAILRVANALDCCHKQKFSDFMISLEEELVMTIATNYDFSLEKADFESNSEFFYQTFGYRPRLNIIRKGSY